MQRQFWILLALLIGFGTVDQGVSAQTPTRDYSQVLNLATIAINGCYQDKRLNECEKLNQIKATLTT